MRLLYPFLPVALEIYIGDIIFLMDIYTLQMSGEEIDIIKFHQRQLIMIFIEFPSILGEE